MLGASEQRREAGVGVMGYWGNGVKTPTLQHPNPPMPSFTPNTPNTQETPNTPNTPMHSLYPANRNAFYRDRDALLTTMELPSENVTFSLANGKRATIKIWGDTSAARAWLSALASDRLEQEKPFTLDDLLAVCEQHQIQMGVLFNAPTSALSTDILEILAYPDIRKLRVKRPALWT